MDMESFFVVHQDLPREGPGSPEDVAWALQLANLQGKASICDAGAGPGSDSAELLKLADANVVAVETHAGFVSQARARLSGEPRFRAEERSMAEVADLPDAPFDLIWCAGALYFLGIEGGLQVFAKALKPGGVVAFSEPCYFVETPSEHARAFWEGYGTRRCDAILDAVVAQGYEVLGHRKISEEGWEAYYQPMEARIAKLRTGADDRLREMLDICAQEAHHWREVRAETGYLLVVARRQEDTP